MKMLLLLTCAGFLIFVHGFGQTPDANHKYLVTIFKPDKPGAEHMEFAQEIYFYLEPGKTEPDTLNLNDRTFTITNFKFWDPDDYLYLCCKHTESTDDPVLLKYFRQLSDSVNKHTSKLPTYKLKTRIKEYEFSITKVDFEYCRCVPEFDYKYSDGTNAIFTFPTVIKSYSKLTKEEKAFFERNVKTISKCSLVRKIIPELR